ncbi:hypothetical protein Kpol_1061p38 [Vanderwaltozyma polyspora DSM 70294]|uniref:Uncharacterized protein n=1 Tax=Vanderwaltozyma polyspora (strain ATCC 22028 / DSM 70294 / BCRC 21397 / CBS 2163 / NBRC 10782 / NRRL Y-8283 / UCD 57-17) TaxID=436907 RepID=A7TJG3_VANPO|nr:uncharacterized protein Kpol_1061p38 [Vanderwaltozyma polyspora DSM 70294]EDO17613.1 hypothetical protein Kpol_1061p38 [Vanderwaltozyma polyspora DSM 70294]
MSNEISDSISQNDNILEMFFDNDFVPQAYVDILLSAAGSKDISQVQLVTSSLLTRLDYYTKHLTSELKSSIGNLEKLSGTIPITWSASNPSNTSSNSAMIANNDELVGSSKLEYYIDTLRSAVRGLEADMSKIDSRLKELDIKYQGDDNVIEQLENLVMVKGRLGRVTQCFEELRSIFEISYSSKTSVNDNINDVITLADFKVSLKTLEETIDESLHGSSKTEKRNERNTELLNKIDHFIELKPVFKGLDNFYPVYMEFADNIKKKADIYLSTKDIEDEF